MDTHRHQYTATTGPRLMRLALLAAVLLLSCLAVTEQMPDWLEEGRNTTMVLIGACAAYAALLALPFVPAVEIGLLIMVLFGKGGAVGAWLATLVGLNLAYVIGYLLARRHNGAWQQRLPAHIETRLQRMARMIPDSWLPVVGLVLMLNLPANALIGGGGGLALIYGATRTLRWPAFAATIAAATSVLPVLFITGLVAIESPLH